MTCTHVVLYVKDVNATRYFYIEQLGCTLRRFSANEKFLSVAVGNFIVNFYGSHPDLEKGYQQGIAHLGFEVEARAIVDTFANCFQTRVGFHDMRNSTQGPYRFYVNDPDGYTVEIHSWEGTNK
jgi:catechol 2,3-dioxygenase-like lactoylglutathione lyase family enzyme